MSWLYCSILADLYRFAFKFSNNNNTRSNTGILFVVATIVVYWLTCSGGNSTGTLGLVYSNRNVWKSNELCNWCSSSWDFIPALWCGVTGWIATWGLCIAVIYWIFARRDEVGRIWEGATERFLLDQGGNQDLPDQPTTQTLSGPPLTLASQRIQRNGRFWWLSFDFLSNVFSDLVTGLLFHRF